MAIQYTGNCVTTSFSGASINSILDGVKTALVAGGWTLVKNRFRAFNVFTNEPFLANPSNGELRGIGSQTYTFVNVFVACPEVQITPSASGTMFNWALEINTCDPVFNSPFGGQVSALTDPRSPSYLYIVAQQDGTAANNLPCTLQSSNFGHWQSPVTFGGGWELVSHPTPSGLQMKVQAVCDFIFGVGIVAHLYIASVLEDVVSQPIQIAVNPVTYTITADPYQFFFYQNGVTDALTSASGGTPYLYSITAPQAIAVVSAPAGGTITCVTASPHGLVNNQRIQIFESVQGIGVINSGVSSFPNALGNTFLNLQSDWQNGDVVQYVSGTHAPQDGTYQINNVTQVGSTNAGFTLDNTYAASGLSGTVAGPAHSINGEWLVTVVDAMTFTLNGGIGSGFSYQTNSALFVKAGQIGRCIWAFGSNDNQNLRNSLRSDANAQFFAINGASYNQLQQGDLAAPRFVFPGLNGRPLNYTNGCAILMEPLLAAGLDGASSQSKVLGQLWDAVLITGAFTSDQQTSVDGHAISAYSNDQGSQFPSPSVRQGSLWIVYQ